MNPQIGSDEHGPKVDWFGLMRRHGRLALTVAASVAAVVAVAGGVYLRWGQGTRMVASLEFRPVFASLAELEYPNGLPFSPNDVTAGPIIDLVYNANDISGVCNRDTFRTGFFVEERSDQSVFLDLEYQARLTEPRITMVERKLLQEEHAAKRKALPFQYRLVFVAPPACAGLAPIVVQKTMVEVLTTWATESETKRGVLNHQVEVLTESTLDVTVDGAGGMLLRADLLRTVLQRIIRNVEQVGKLPGAALIRLGPQKLTFVELQGRLVDLIGSRLDPLVMTSGRSMVKEASLWVAETVAAAERKQQGAQQKIKYYQDALRDFSGNSVAVGSGRGPAATGTGSNSTSPQGTMPPIDGSFIDRIVELSDTNAKFRQALTESMVEAQLEAVYEEQRASYYRRLQSLSGPADADSTELGARLDAIAKEGKRLTRQFGQLYDEFSRVALRAAGSMYEAPKPVMIQTSRPVSGRSLLNLVLVTFVGALVLTFGFFGVRSRLKLEPR